MLSTYIEELHSSGKISQKGECNYFTFIILSFIEYEQFVTVGQTHSLTTHKRYYVKQSIDKKRKYEEGQQMQNLYESLFQDHPLPIPSILQTTTGKLTTESSITTTNPSTTELVEESIVDDNNIEDMRGETVNSFEQIEKTIEEPVVNLDSSPPTGQREIFNQLLQQSSYQISNIPSPENIIALNFMDFGVARKDLEYYIQYIEEEADKKNRFATCLNHHVATSDRLKNGFNAVLKRIV